MFPIESLYTRFPLSPTKNQEAEVPKKSTLNVFRSRALGQKLLACLGGSAHLATLKLHIILTGVVI